MLPININLSILILSIIAFLTLYIPFFIKQKNSKKNEKNFNIMYCFFLIFDCAVSKDNELLSKDFSHYFNYKIYLKNTSQHTSFKPYINANLDITQVIDSIYPYDKNIGKLKQGFFYNYPLIISEDDYRIVAYP